MLAKIGVTVYGLGYGFCVGWPVLVVFWLLEGKMEASEIFQAFGIWMASLVITATVGHLSMPIKPGFGSYYVLRRFGP